MEQAKIREKIEMLLEKSGWKGLMDITYSMDVLLVSQFLATFRAGLLDGGMSGIMFEIDGSHHQLSNLQVRRSLGMSQVWNNFRLTTDDIKSLWEDLAKTRREDRQYRQELQLIKKPEFFYLYKMLVEGLKPDWVQLLVDHWKRVRRNQNWDVSCGGVITRILYDQGIIGESSIRTELRFARYIDAEELLRFGEIFIDQADKVHWMYLEDEEDYDIMLERP